MKSLWSTVTQTCSISGKIPWKHRHSTSTNYQHVQSRTRARRESETRVNACGGDQTETHFQAGRQAAEANEGRNPLQTPARSHFPVSCISLMSSLNWRVGIFLILMQIGPASVSVVPLSKSARSGYWPSLSSTLPKVWAAFSNCIGWFSKVVEELGGDVMQTTDWSFCCPLAGNRLLQFSFLRVFDEYETPLTGTRRDQLLLDSVDGYSYIFRLMA